MAAWFIILSVALAPYPFDGILSGLVAYGLLRHYTRGSVRPMLGRRDHDPLPVLAVAIGGMALVLSTGFLVFSPELRELYRWVPVSGATVILFTLFRRFSTR